MILQKSYKRIYIALLISFIVTLLSLVLYQRHMDQVSLNEQAVITEQNNDKRQAIENNYSITNLPSYDENHQLIKLRTTFDVSSSQSSQTDINVRIMDEQGMIELVPFVSAEQEYYAYYDTEQELNTAATHIMIDWDIKKGYMILMILYHHIYNYIIL